MKQFKLTVFLLSVGMMAMSCAKYSWTVQEVKLSTVGNKLKMTAIKKPYYIGDTTITGYFLTRRRIK